MAGTIRVHLHTTHRLELRSFSPSPSREMSWRDGEVELQPGANDIDADFMRKWLRANRLSPLIDVVIVDRFETDDPRDDPLPEIKR